jgi:hypothetical protein
MKNGRTFEKDESGDRLDEAVTVYFGVQFRHLVKGNK